MAITASIALSVASCLAEQQVSVTVTVSNSGAAAVAVTAIQPTLTPNGATVQSVAAAIGSPPLGGAFNVVVPASGTLAINWPIVAHAPTSGFGNAMPSPFVYSVGATIYTSDGAITVATPTTLSVANPGH